MKAMPYLILLILTISCATSNKSVSEVNARERMKSFDQASQENINSLIEMIDEQEQVTDQGAKHYIPYEFMIPLESAKRNEVQRIDSTIRFTNRTTYYQCIGGHATKEKVYQIVALPYTKKV